MKKDRFLITGLGGKRTLAGELTVSGAKNAILKLMASSLIFKTAVTFSNVPEIEDVRRMGEMLQDLGAAVSFDRSGFVSISTENVKKTTLDREIAKRMRSSIIVTGPLLARFGAVSFPHPGGCVIGDRPIDMFLEGYQKMGAVVSISKTGEDYEIKAPNGLVGAEIFFRIPSVTNTETFMMTAVLAWGRTVLQNAAMEPEIESLAEFLNKSGAKISGAGTPTITIEGGGLLESGGVFETMPDRIEAGSFLILAALAGKEISITHCEPRHLIALTEALRESGVPLEIGKSSISVSLPKNMPVSDFKSVNIKTHEYPGFPTDLQAPMTVFLTQVTGESLIHETIFENRLNYAPDLVRMGADIKVWDAHRVLVTGPTILKGRELFGPDLRAGLAYIMAAIIAEGDSIINNVYFIDRGYSKIEERLAAVGVSIERLAE